MKTSIQLLQPLINKIECKSTLRKLLSVLSSLGLLALPLDVQMRLRMKSLSLVSVTQALQHGLIVSLHSLRRLCLNKRHLVGMVLLVVGVFGVFAHQFFLDPYVEDHQVCGLLGFTPSQCDIRNGGWCYVSWFYYWETIRFCVAAIMLTTAVFLFIPPSKSLAFIPCSLIQGAAWAGVFHYSFFAVSHETYHMFPAWYFIVTGLTLGFGVIMSSDYLLYWYNHKVRGNHARFAGVAEMNLAPQEKEQMFRLLAKEYRQINKMI